MELITHLNNAINYIEENICDDIELDMVSKVTTYSPYHFGRLFYYIAEMPISEYIRKRKLSLAAIEIQGSNIKVIDVAIKYGYDNADSFTRAFVKQHGVTPSVARGKGVNLKLFLPLNFQIKIKGVQGMNWRIEKKEEFEVFGIERIFRNDETNKVPEFWSECHKNGSYEKLFDDALGDRQIPYNERRGICTINAICGYSDPGADIFPYMICAFNKIGCKTSGYKIFTMPETTWAIFRSEDSDDIGVHIPVLFNRAYSEWLPTSGYDKATGPDFEIYGITDSGKYFEEVWIPVVKK